MGQGRGGESKYSPRRIAATLRQAEAIRYRSAGLEWHVIAEKLGYKTPEGAIMAVKAGLLKTLQPPADERRALVYEQLREVLRSFWPGMLKQDPKAAGVVLAALEDVRQLLGLDLQAPAVTAIQVNVGGDGLLDQLQRMEAQLTPPKEEASGQSQV